MSTQVRTLAEMAIVRICRLEDLDELAALIEQLKAGDPAAAVGPAKKNAPPSPRPAPNVTAAAPRRPQVLPAGKPPATNGAHQTTSDPSAAPEAEVAKSAPVALDEDSVESIWSNTLNRLAGLVADSAAAANKLSVDAQGRLVASFPESHKFSRDTCQRPTNLSRIESALAEVCGGRVPLVLATHADPQAARAAAPVRTTHKQQQAEIAATPFVQKAMELFDGDPSKLRLATPGGES
jgi:DNA polymerase-3 subunit gamma/tau